MVYMTQTLVELEQEVANQGLTHELMLTFFRMIPTNDPVAILPTFTTWVTQLETAGVTTDTVWFDRMVSDFTTHGRLTHETLIQADVAPVVQLGMDDPDDF